MRILLLQEAVYLPSYGGGNKANRLLLSELAKRGHQCHAIAKALSMYRGLVRQSDRPVLAERGIAIDHEDTARMSYRCDGVQVDAFHLTGAELAAHIHETIRRVQPELILVSDDRRRNLLEAALRLEPDRVALIVHTHLHLPFGPEAQTEDDGQVARMREVRGIIAVSNYVCQYLERYGGLTSTLLRFPVYGSGPFRQPKHPESGYITMVNPCVIKGLPIFLELAALFPDVPFAAVPTWGADAAAMSALAALPNIRLLEPADDIDEIMQRTRVLLVPSLIPETFGYVAVEAMLRGIPVLASNLGGLPEAKLGVDYVLPVTAVIRNGDEYIAPAQDIGTWSAALQALLSDRQVYDRCADASQEAALRFVNSINVGHIEKYLSALSCREAQAG